MKATEPPSWVEAAESTFVLKDGLETRPEDDLEAKEGDVELVTHIQEKGRDPALAGFTCPMCPFPYRPINCCRCEDPVVPEGYEHGVDMGLAPVLECRPRYNYGDGQTIEGRGCGLPLRFTERCADCQRGIKRWSKGKKLADDIEFLRGMDGIDAAFVTLTIPNIHLPHPATNEDVVREVKNLKKEVAKWRRTVGVADHFIGGLDFYEVTDGKDRPPRGEGRASPAGAGGNEVQSSLNVHHHGVWVQGGFWKQDEMQEAWGRGVVHITRVKNSRQALRYLTAYASKEPIRGVRTQERWGYCRGTVLSALRQSQVNQDTDASDVQDASD